MNIIGPINSMGYGQSVKNLCLSLSRQGRNFRHYPIGNNQYESQEELERLSGHSYLNGYDPNAPTVKIYHQHDLLLSFGGKRIGFPIFELDSFSKLEQTHLVGCDEIIVCSKWAADIVENLGIRAKIVNLGYDASIFFQNPTIKRKEITFINIGKWEKRKGHDLLPEIFSKALPQTANYKLWMVNTNPFLSEDETNHWKYQYHSVLGDKVSFIDRMPTQSALARLINQADCGIYPSRAEGWNLPLMETMACGVPCIVNNYSAHTEFCNDQNSILIDPVGMESAYDGKWFFNQGNWSTPNVVGFSNAVGYVYDTLSNGRGLGINPDVSSFSWDNAAKQLWDAVNI